MHPAVPRSWASPTSRWTRESWTCVLLHLGFGRTGPLSGELGLDQMLQAFTGIMSFMGEPDRPPVRVAVSAIDMLTGALAFGGVLSALLERQRSGLGQQVEASLYDSSLSMLSWAIPQVSATGVLPRRSGSGFDHVAPYGVFEAADDFVYIGVATPAHWRRFCAALSLDVLVDDPRFDMPDRRVENRESLKVILAAEFLRWSSEDLVGRLKAAGVPCSKLRTVADVLKTPTPGSGGAFGASSRTPILRLRHRPSSWNAACARSGSSHPTSGRTRGKSCKPSTAQRAFPDVPSALVVGGAGPTGRQVVAGLVERGFTVSVFHTGRHEVDHGPQVRHIHGDPHFAETIAESLGALAFDVVIAQYGRLRHLIDFFRGRTGHFIAIGSATRIIANTTSAVWGPLGRPGVMPGSWLDPLSSRLETTIRRN